MSIRQQFLITFILVPLLSWSQNCVEIFEVKQIVYDMSKPKDHSQTSEEFIISEKIINPEDDNLYHIYNSDYSLSLNYFGVEITERKSNRRYVKRNSDHFEEQLKHEENSFVPEPIATGRRKTIGDFECAEYIIEQNYATNLTFWITEDYPFIYLYQHPCKFPGFVVSRQGNVGEHGIVETIYDLKRVNCTNEFLGMIKELGESR